MASFKIYFKLILMGVVLLLDNSAADNNYVEKCISDINLDLGEFDNNEKRLEYIFKYKTYNDLQFAHGQIYFEALYSDLQIGLEMITASVFCETKFNENSEKEACHIYMKVRDFPLNNQKAAVEVAFYNIKKSADDPTVFWTSYIQYIVQNIKLKKALKKVEEYCNELPKLVGDCVNAVKNSCPGSINDALKWSQSAILRTEKTIQAYQPLMSRLYLYYFSPFVYPGEKLRSPNFYCQEEYKNDQDKCLNALRAGGFTKNDGAMLVLKRALYKMKTRNYSKNKILENFVLDIQSNYILEYKTLNVDQFCQGIKENTLDLVAFVIPEKHLPIPVNESKQQNNTSKMPVAFETTTKHGLDFVSRIEKIKKRTFSCFRKDSVNETIILSQKIVDFITPYNENKPEDKAVDVPKDEKKKEVFDSTKYEKKKEVFDSTKYEFKLTMDRYAGIIAMLNWTAPIFKLPEANSKK